MMNDTIDIITGITTEPTHYALIIGLVISLILFLLNTKVEIINICQYFEKLYSNNILNENEILETKTPDELKEQKFKLKRFLQLEGAKISLNIQYKISSLKLGKIIPTR